MKKNLVLLAVVSFLAGPLVSFSQEPSTQPDTLVWKKKLNFAINLNQASPVGVLATKLSFFTRDAVRREQKTDFTE